MPGILRLSVKEAKNLADLIEREGGNADNLRAVLEDVNDSGDDGSSPLAGNMDDEKYLAEKRSQSSIEHGTDLECMICHGKFDQLLSGTCEVCFREWILSTKPKSITKRLF